MYLMSMCKRVIFFTSAFYVQKKSQQELRKSLNSFGLSFEQKEFEYQNTLRSWDSLPKINHFLHSLCIMLHSQPYCLQSQ